VIEFRGQRIASQQRRAWKGARKLAGLGPECTPHILKHTCATLLLLGGMDIEALSVLLQTSPATIRKYYGHHAQEHIRKAANAAWAKSRKLAAVQ
jgi:integrase